MNFYQKQNNLSKGFTLIELLVVISIVSLLSSVVFSSLNVARSEARDVHRRAQMKQIQTALESFHNDNGAYPSTSCLFYSSEEGDWFSHNGGDWIPGLAPNYIPVLPRDPRGGMDSLNPACLPPFEGSPSKSVYLYQSDGVGYRLLSSCAAETPWTSDDPFYDPISPTWGWQITTPNSCAYWH